MRNATYGKGLPALALATVVTICAALALVFFYAPLDADQGFLQKIFYIHVPLAIVVAVRVHPRRGDGDHATCAPAIASGTCAPTCAIHMALIFGVARADHRLDLGQGVLGPLVGLEEPTLVSYLIVLLLFCHLPAAAVLDRGSRAPGALRERVRDRRRRVRATELHRRAAARPVRAPARADPRGRRAAGLDAADVLHLAGRVRAAVRDADGSTRWPPRRRALAAPAAAAHAARRRRGAPVGRSAAPS